MICRCLLKRRWRMSSSRPFTHSLDGNGRLGRLLITFLLRVAGAIGEPILYLSLYFKTHRQHYYELLDRERTAGDWEAWLEFFLNGVKETSAPAAQSAHQTLTLFEEDRHKIERLGQHQIRLDQTRSDSC